MTHEKLAEFHIADDQVQVNRDMRRGRIADCVTNYVRDRGIDWVSIAQSGVGAFNKKEFRNTVDRILDVISIPVLIEPFENEAESDRIRKAVDAVDIGNHLHPLSNVAKVAKTFDAYRVTSQNPVSADGMRMIPDGVSASTEQSRQNENSARLPRDRERLRNSPLRGYTVYRCIARAALSTPPESHLNHPTTHPGLIMLTIKGPSSRYCDGQNRRSFLKIGGLSFGVGGLSLADLYRAEASSDSSRSHKSVINIFLAGGPPHQDMWDIKADAPSEVRGEFQPINTNVPGIQICEVFPKLAGLMDKAAVIRSVVGCRGGHDGLQCFSGWDSNSLKNVGGRPSIGSAAARLFGPVDPSVPPFVGLAAPTKHVPWSDSGQSGFLGSAYTPFKPDGPGMQNMTLKGISFDRLQDRRQLLTELDTMRRDIDISGAMDGMDAFGQRALDVLTSSKLVDALDLSKEDPKIVARYGDGKPYKYQYDGAPTCNDQLLIARRLVEAGVRVVSLSFGRWDSHSENFDLVRDHGGKLDQCLSALVVDLDQRGMLDDVAIAVWGEFGRTPKINPSAGRDHWTKVSCAWLAGGGLKTGQAIGATNRMGEEAVERPVDMQEVVATLYHTLGVDTQSTTIADPTGRPQFLVDSDPIAELVA